MIALRAAKPPSITDATLIDDTEDPKVLVDRLRELKPLEQQVLLLIGSVGSGKSTFVDYLTEVGLPRKVLEDTLWIHINMNTAPVSREVIYDWLARQIMEGCRNAHAEVDHDELANVERVYAVELLRFRKGVGKLFSPTEPEYRTRLADEITRLQNDPEISAKAYSRYWASERSKLLIVVLDNCDKRVRDEQLLMFQAAEWLQREFRVLVILPLRDETYDNHRHEPPLDTALKDLVFRIEPPLFQHVLTRRVQLALKEIGQRVKSKTLYYNLPNAMRVEYPADDQAFYLTSILRSLYEHDRYLRRMIVGISGRDLRYAMEIFLEICHSAHITEDQIFRIRQSEGQYVLPLHLVARVLLRMNRRFYDGESAYLKNILALDPSDGYPNYFARLLILRWLMKRFRESSATGLVGYKSVRDLKAELVSYGISEAALDREILFLLRAHCIVAEHLRTDGVVDDDLVKLASPGFVHLESLGTLDYLSAISEDTWYADTTLAQRIADRIGSDAHYEVNTSIQNARDLINYLHQQQKKAFPSPDAFLAHSSLPELLDLSECVNEVERVETNRRRYDPWFEAERRYRPGEKYEGVVVNRVDFGVFIELEPGVTGLAHRSVLSTDFLNNPDYMAGENVVVLVVDLEPLRKRMSLRIIGDSSGEQTS